MEYIEVNFQIQPFEEYVIDVLISELGEIGFNSFEPNEDGVNAYIVQTDFNEANLKKMLDNFPLEASIDYKVTKIESKNWNEEWEKNYFEPILIGNECVIHSSFHKQVPKADFDIVIDPKMAFGTGHHETTSLMIARILGLNLKDKSVLDMGCGTSVLAILAAKKGAKPITAIDVDDWCTENSLENIALNHVEGIDVLRGDAELLEGKIFDVIFANINRNILLEDMSSYASCLPHGGELYMSGFYVEDIPLIEAEANACKLQLIDHNQKNNWVEVKMVKE